MTNKLDDLMNSPLDDLQSFILAALLGGMNMGFDRPSVEEISRVWYSEPKNRRFNPDIESVCLTFWRQYMDSDKYDAVIEECGGWLFNVKGNSISTLAATYPSVQKILEDLSVSQVKSAVGVEPK